MKRDTIKIEVTEAGMLKIETDGISAANHQNAEGFIRALTSLAGGATDVKRKVGSHAAHTHTHGEETHTH